MPGTKRILAHAHVAAPLLEAANSPVPLLRFPKELLLLRWPDFPQMILVDGSGKRLPACFQAGMILKWPESAKTKGGVISHDATNFLRNYATWRSSALVIDRKSVV